MGVYSREDIKSFIFSMVVLFVWTISVSSILFFRFGGTCEKQEEEIITTTPEIVEVEVVRYATLKENIEHKQKEVDALCKIVWGEARGCSKTKQAAVIWCVLNRVEDDRFPDDIMSVLLQKNQFYGYIPDYPIDVDIKLLVTDVLNRWYIECESLGSVGTILPKEYCWYRGNGIENVFRDAYSGDYNIWDWSLESPYKED